MGKTVRVGDVCRLAGDAQVTLSVSERNLRKGPYPLYAENCTKTGIDDYALEEGGTVLVGAVGQIVTSKGTLGALLECGRCSASEHVHALVPHDPDDARYLWRVLATSPHAAPRVMGTSQLRQLGATSLLSLPIPWPERALRQGYVERLEAFERRASELAERVPELLAQGDEAFARTVAASGADLVEAGEVSTWLQGTNVPAALRGPGKPVRVEGPLGVLGRCDEVLSEGRVVVVGPSGRRLLAHVVDGPCHPIAEMRYTDAAHCDVPLSVLFFALRAAGLFDRMKLGGELLEAPRLAVGDLAGLTVQVGTPEARAAFAPQGDALIDALVQALRDADACVAERHAFIADFFDKGLFAGEAFENVDPPAPRGTSITAVRAKLAREGRAEAAAAAAAAAPCGIDPQRLDSLGALAGVLRAHPCALDPADLAWELGPLACVRACADPAAWESVARAAREGAAGVADALDAAMAGLVEQDDLLSFLPNLSYQSSLLEPEALAAWVGALDAIEAPALDAASVRAAFALEPGPCGLPGAVQDVLAAVIEALAPTFAQPFETAYVPREASGAVVDLLGRVAPEVTMRAQFDEFSQMLATAMVRAVALRSMRETRGGLGAAAGSPLVADEFPDWRAQLVVAELPPNPGEWTTRAVDARDPRWVLGMPPRSRANYAWLQQALSRQERGGATVLLTSDSLLHANSGLERKLRHALAESGRVRLVASLPARIFEDGRAPMSLLVLGDEGSAPECLMVNGLGLGERIEGAFSGDAPERVLPTGAARRIADACRAWLSASGRPEEPGFCRAVTVAELRANEDQLVPWAYV